MMIDALAGPELASSWLARTHFARGRQAPLDPRLGPCVGTGKGPDLRPAMSLESHELAECHPPSCLL